MVEVGPVQLDRIRSAERGSHEVTVRHVIPAQVELPIHCAKRGAAAFDRPALVASWARLEHLQGARRGWRRGWRTRRGDSAAQKGGGQVEHLAASGARTTRPRKRAVLAPPSATEEE
eukprot:scaffold11201_cov36-Phaeocystis_antarctica.AAC.1